MWYANSPLYCGKLLYVAEGKSTSQHFHLNKTEDILVDMGTLYLTLWEDAIETSHILEAGDSVTITPGLVHRLTGGPDGVVLYEFSTQHFDDDSYRVSR